MTEREKYNWACKQQGFEGTYEEWMSLPADERQEYDDGAAGIGTS